VENPVLAFANINRDSGAFMSLLFISASNTEEEAEYIVLFGFRMVPGVDWLRPHQEALLLYDQCVPFAILKPKNRKTSV
jgi:hypothetical protein